MPSYDAHQRQRRQTYASSTRSNTWGHWLPLAITVTVAAGGLAAWIWKERRDHDDDDHDYDRPPPGISGPPGYDSSSGSAIPPGYGPAPGYNNQSASGFGVSQPGQPGYGATDGNNSYGSQSDNRAVEEQSIVSKMSGALRRTPSPQQIFDGASKRVVAGVAAAGAAVGGALSSITEEEKRDYEDHRSWSEEADSQIGEKRSRTSRKEPPLDDTEELGAKFTRPNTSMPGKRKSVAIIVSALATYDHDDEASYHQENASILSHLPEHLDGESRVFVLIYTPDLKQHPLAKTADEGQLPASMGSSFSNIAREDTQSPEGNTTRSKMFDSLYKQAQTLVEKDTMIMPFTTTAGFIPMLRHLGPEIVYLQATLAGAGGEHLTSIKNWVDQIVVVVGDESGHGGLVDSEDEHAETAEKWWVNDSRIGLGKGVEVVDGLRVGEDFRRRVSGHD